MERELFIPTYWWTCHCGNRVETEDLVAPHCGSCKRRMFRTSSWAPWNRGQTKQQKEK